MFKFLMINSFPASLTCLSKIILFIVRAKSKLASYKIGFDSGLLLAFYNYAVFAANVSSRFFYSLSNIAISSVGILSI